MPYAPLAIAVTILLRSTDAVRNTTRVHELSDVVAARISSPLRPGELRERIAADIRAVAADPTSVARMAATGQVVDVRLPSLPAVIEQQRAKLTTVAAALDIKLKQ